ncbi:MCE family protein [Mycobacterium sp. pUA109]|uniref:MCE family protein n=1 Tax=Mycobacterium sp. pUA109 TaxID=3238982 RepID=UPI00351B4665
MADPTPTSTAPTWIQRWRHRPLESYNKTRLGFVALTVLTVLVGTSLTWRLVGVGYTHYTAEFLQAASLHPGNPVTIAGIEVGKVTSMKLDGDHVEAGLSVRNDIALGKDTRAVIKVMTVLGSRYLELLPDGPDTLPHKTIGLAHTEVPYDLQSLLEDATTTFEQVDSDQFGKSLQVLGAQLQGMPTVVPQAMTNLHTLSTIVASRRDQIGSLLANTQRVATTLHTQQANLGTLVDQGQDLLGRFVAREDTFHAMLAALTRLVTSLSQIVVNDRPLLGEMLTNLHALTDMIGQHDDLFRDLLQVAPVSVRDLTNASGYGPAFEFNVPGGLAIDSWLCAISGRAKQFNMPEYFKDCK